MGGIFPEPIPKKGRVLDAACGPGGWLLELARLYHEDEVTAIGIDIAQDMLDYATGQAVSQEIDNISFKAMDITQPLDFEDNSFDVVNSRLVGFFEPTFWPTYVKELIRVTRPGGYVRLVETEMSFTNGPATEAWLAWFFRALWSSHQSFSSNGERLSITAMLAPLLRRAGLQEVKVQATGIDWSAGTDEVHSIMVENFRIASRGIEPFFLTQGIVADQATLDRNYEQMVIEMQQPDFAAMHYLLAAWGRKPM
jgi:ubiquinone/menaquinone biosynthesis C-methylase UbiE